jgi:hypothetical protein
MESCTFQSNIGTNGGSDVYENNTLQNTLFSASTVVFCCSLSVQPRFSLNNGDNLNSLLPACDVTERYVASSVSATDVSNPCTV